MNKKRRALIIIIAAAIIIALLANYLGNHTVAILQPKGSIAKSQKDLLVFATLLSTIVVIPVFIMTGYIAWKYRATNHKARYTPDWDRNRVLEAIWWGIPITLITVLSVITWRTSHSLDPFKPIASDKKPLTIQVVALQWKWLFIYPDQNIATVSYAQIPEDTPVRFVITSDAPMNSFWIPQLGGQIYAMSGMSTELNLVANETGEYYGSSANISGEGFASMKFMTKASSDSDFAAWVKSSKNSDRKLSKEEYKQLSKPSVQENPISYSSVADGLYDTVVMKFMLPEGKIDAAPARSHHGIYQ